MAGLRRLKHFIEHDDEPAAKRICSLATLGTKDLLAVVSVLDKWE